MTRLTIMQATIAGLSERMREDSSVFLLGQDVGPFGGVMQSTLGMWEEFGATGRILEAPISETAVTGMAAGASFQGARPVLEIMFADFLVYSLPTIFEAGTVHARSGGRLTAPLVIRAKYGVGPHRGHPETGYELFSGMAGVKVVAPSTPQSAYDMIRAAIVDPNPVIFMEHMSLIHGRRGEVDLDAPLIEIGKGRRRRQCEHLTVVAFGLMVERADKVARKLVDEGIEVDLIDLVSLAPLDFDLVLESVNQTGRLLVIDESPSGISTELIAEVSSRAYDKLLAPPVWLRPDKVPVPFALPLEKAHVPDEDRIAGAIRKLMS